MYMINFQLVLAQRTAAGLSFIAFPFNPFFDTLRVELVLAKVQGSQLCPLFEIFKTDAAWIRCGSLLLKGFCC
jgi:hypothetical protein